VPATPVGGSATFPRPTLRVVAALALVAVLTVALRLTGDLTAALVVAVAAAWCVDALALRAAPVELHRTCAATVVRGERTSLTLHVTGGARVRRLRQPVPPELSLSPAEVPGRDLAAVLVATARGRHVVPPGVARVAGPLGLATTDVRGGGATDVDALPDLPRARRLAVRRRGAAGAEGAAVRRRGLGTEFESVRDYDDNDDVRLVNWMATSRCGRPMTNQFRVDENRDLVCLVDVGRLMCAPAGEATRLDVALDALCVLGVAADGAGDRVGVTAFADETRRHLAPRRRGTPTVVHALFDLQPEEVDSDFRGAFQGVALRKRSIVVVFTDLVDPAASRSLLEALPVLGQRHEVLVAAVRDAELHALAAARPRGFDDVARTAAALRLLDEHRDVVRRVAALGAQVVVAAPDRLGPACVTAYTRLKSRARA
jgi:uncharacterized protein (DUF58 family)